MTNSSFHIYDNHKDYSLTNIRDILFNLDEKDDTENPDIEKGRSSHMNLFGEGGFGIRHFVTINLFLTTALAHINKMSIHAAMPYMLNNTAIRSNVILNRAAHKNAYTEYSDSDSESDDDDSNNHTMKDEYDCPFYGHRLAPFFDGPFEWSLIEKRAAIYSFYYSFIPALIPASLIARSIACISLTASYLLLIASFPTLHSLRPQLLSRFGAKPIISAGLLVQSLFAMMIPVAAETGMMFLQIVRIIQGIALAPVLPCTYMLLAKWIPPCERCRMVSVVLSGSIMGGMILNYFSRILCECQLCGGCAAHFYFFAACSVMLSMLFTFFMWEDPETCPVISDKERHYILNELGRLNIKVPSSVPWISFITSKPCWALLFTEVAEEYFLITAFNELPQYMEAVLHSPLASYDLMALLPYLLMLSSSLMTGLVTDCVILHSKMTTTNTRKLANSIAQYGGMIGICTIAHIGCNPDFTIAILSITMLINGAHLSGFKVNYFDITHNFTGILVAITSVMGNLSGLASHNIALKISMGEKKLQKWQVIFFVSALVLGAAATCFIFMTSSVRQHWDIERLTDSKSKNVTFMKKPELEPERKEDVSGVMEVDNK